MINNQVNGESKYPVKHLIIYTVGTHLGLNSFYPDWF